MDVQTAVACTVGGSDNSGVAGIQADLKTFQAHEVWGTLALTCVTAQNPCQFTHMELIEPKLLVNQLETVLGYFTVGALKTGLLGCVETIQSITQVLERLYTGPIIVDPVMVNSQGKGIVPDEVAKAYIQYLTPAAELITPNLDEAAIFLGYPIKTISQMMDAAYVLSEKLGVAILLKGGHLKGEKLVDIFVDKQGKQHLYEAQFRKNCSMRGSGCTLAAAITALRARGVALHEAVAQAHDYLQGAIAHPLNLQEQSYICHTAKR